MWETCHCCGTHTRHEARHHEAAGDRTTCTCRYTHTLGRIPHAPFARTAWRCRTQQKPRCHRWFQTLVVATAPPVESKDQWAGQQHQSDKPARGTSYCRTLPTHSHASTVYRNVRRIPVPKPTVSMHDMTHRCFSQLLPRRQQPQAQPRRRVSAIDGALRFHPAAQRGGQQRWIVAVACVVVRVVAVGADSNALPRVDVVPVAHMANRVPWRP
jgi:hypothetical protein